MLILTRRAQEVIFIILEDGTEIKLRVTKIKDDVVSLGIEAPKSVKIVREEIKDIKYPKST